jgi:hypothetical protein
MPLPKPTPTVVQSPRSAGVGLDIPERRADCSGVRPSWFPFQVNVCDCGDAPDPDPYSGRDLSLPAPSSVFPWPRHDPCGW